MPSAAPSARCVGPLSHFDVVPGLVACCGDVVLNYLLDIALGTSPAPSAVSSSHSFGRSRIKRLAPAVRDGCLYEGVPDRDVEFRKLRVSDLTAILQLTDDNARMHLDGVGELVDSLRRVKRADAVDE